MKSESGVAASPPYLRNPTAEERVLLGRLDRERLPNHIAVIMDGNRRWARERRWPAFLGHRAGVRAFREMVRACTDLGIGVLTAYAFSWENWKRSQQEVRILMRLFEHYSRKDREEMHANGVRFRIIGDTTCLPQEVQAEFNATSALTRNNNSLILNLAVNYGSRHEILRATRLVAREIAEGRLDPDALQEEDLSSYFYTAGLPDPDLLIRTSGEMRVSNFLLWQIAYSEFWFTDRNWPAFQRSDLLRALIDYQGRDRRFGGGGEVDADARILTDSRAHVSGGLGGAVRMRADVAAQPAKICSVVVNADATPGERVP